MFKTLRLFLLNDSYIFFFERNIKKFQFRQLIFVSFKKIVFLLRIKWGRSSVG